MSFSFLSFSINIHHEVAFLSFKCFSVKAKIKKNLLAWFFSLSALWKPKPVFWNEYRKTFNVRWELFGFSKEILWLLSTGGSSGLMLLYRLWFLPFSQGRDYKTFWISGYLWTKDDTVYLMRLSYTFLALCYSK